ncbi:hypothetical protein GCM10019016_130520 [Streptomyces prasinosporus]|uniref:Uncharacterized protein n=1 Tax=Streptomyces prasinosporus TaxID=68256 RepID=A0ABP6UDU0_9ACTN
MRRPIIELLAPGALFMKNRGAGVPADKWVRVDTGTLSDGNLVTGGATDPFAAAEVLRGTREATFVGRTEVAGDAGAALPGDGGPGAGRAGRLGREPRSAGRGGGKGSPRPRCRSTSTSTTRDRIRKVRYRFSFVNGERDAPVTVASTTLLYGFGAPAEVRLPGREDIYAGEPGSPRSDRPRTSPSVPCAVRGPLPTLGSR